MLVLATSFQLIMVILLGEVMKDEQTPIQAKVILGLLVGFPAWYLLSQLIF